MKKYILVVIVLLLFIPGWAIGGAAPKKIGGLVLGENIDSIKDKLKMDTMLPIRHILSLQEYETRHIPGFKSGLVYVTTCQRPNTVARIKLKYADSSKKFYDELLRRFKDKFGPPTEWRGDSFQVVIGWKWSFKDEDNNSISLILQHNTKDYEEKIGNTIKLSLPDVLYDEMACYNAKHSDEDKPVSVLLEKHWENYLPD
jgi:hypothetical protein